MTPELSLGSDNRCLPFSTHFSFCLSLHLSSRSCNAPFVRGSVTLVGSRCAGQEYTPTSALFCSRGGIVAPTGCPWDNWHRTSCYWPLFWCNTGCCEVFPCGKNDYVLQLCLCSTLAVSCDQSFQSSLVVMPTVYLRRSCQFSGEMGFLHFTDRQAGRCIQQVRVVRFGW